jgi:hypothetical protein
LARKTKQGVTSIVNFGWHISITKTMFINNSSFYITRIRYKKTLCNHSIYLSFLGHLVHHVRMGQTIKACVQRFPSISIAASIQPITRTVLRVLLTIRPEFEWNDKIHGSSEPWWIWVEDPDHQHIYHSEYFLLHKKQVSIRSRDA